MMICAGGVRFGKFGVKLKLETLFLAFIGLCRLHILQCQGPLETINGALVIVEFHQTIRSQ